MYDITSDSANHATKIVLVWQQKKNAFSLKKRSQEMADYQINTLKHIFSGRQDTASSIIL